MAFEWHFNEKQNDDNALYFLAGQKERPFWPVYNACRGLIFWTEFSKKNEKFDDFTLETFVQCLIEILSQIEKHFIQEIGSLTILP